MNNIEPKPPLVWEDEPAGSGRWWLSRAREIVPHGRIDYFIAEDDLTPTFVAVALLPGARKYRVIGVASFASGTSGSAVMAAKTAAAAWRKRVHKHGPIYRWRFARFARLIERDLPLTAAGVTGGAALGSAVAFVAASSRFSGWPLVLAGLVIGAVAGPGLKFLVDRNVGEAYPRPWARFAVATAAAIAGAVSAAGVALTLYWS